MKLKNAGVGEYLFWKRPSIKGDKVFVLHKISEEFFKFLEVLKASGTMMRARLSKIWTTADILIASQWGKNLMILKRYSNYYSIYSFKSNLDI